MTKVLTHCGDSPTLDVRESAIAPVAQQSANAAGVVVVVDGQPLSGRVGVTQGARAILPLVHLGILLKCQAILSDCSRVFLFGSPRSTGNGTKFSTLLTSPIGGTLAPLGVAHSGAAITGLKRVSVLSLSVVVKGAKAFGLWPHAASLNGAGRVGRYSFTPDSRSNWVAKPSQSVVMRSAETPRLNAVTAVINFAVHANQFSVTIPTA